MPAVALARLQQLTAGRGFEARHRFWDYAVWLLADGSVWVIDNYCEHVGGPLVDGFVQDGCVVCPWHGWTYELATGNRRTALGATPGLRSYRAWVEDGQVWADLPDDPLA